MIAVNGIPSGIGVSELLERLGPSLERHELVFKNGLHATLQPDNQTVDRLTGTELTVGELRYRSGDPVASIALDRLDDDLFMLDPATRVRVLADERGRSVRFEYPAGRKPGFSDRLRIGGASLGLPERLIEVPLGPTTRSRPVADGRLQVHGPITVKIQDEHVVMVHGTHLLVGSCLFLRYGPIAELECLLERLEALPTPSPGSVKHVFRNKARERLLVGESRQYPGQCMGFTLGQP